MNWPKYIDEIESDYIEYEVSIDNMGKESKVT